MKRYRRNFFSKLNHGLIARLHVLLLIGGFLLSSPANATGSAKDEVSMAAWIDEAEMRVSDAFGTDVIGRLSQPRITIVAVTFNTRGHFYRAKLKASSCNRTLDYQAIDIARHTHFPPLPKAWIGAPLTIDVNIHFGEDAPSEASIHTTAINAGSIKPACRLSGVPGRKPPER